MIKVLVKYLLSLCILLLLSGYSQLSANTHEGATRYVPAKNHVPHERTAVSTAQEQEALITKTAAFGAEKESHHLDLSLFEGKEEKEEREDDDESTSLKKHLKSGSPAFISYASAFGYFLRDSKNIVPALGYASCASSQRYLIFQVFRI